MRPLEQALQDPSVCVLFRQRSLCKAGRIAPMVANVMVSDSSMVAIFGRFT